MTSTRVRRVALADAGRGAELESAWRRATGGLRSAFLRVGWAERDDTLHELAVCELANAKAGLVRGVLLSTGSRAELLVCSASAVVDADLERVTEQMLVACDGMRVGPVATADVHAPVAPAEVWAGASPSASPPELLVLRAAGRPHLHLYYPGAGAGAAYRELVAALPAHWTITACDDVAHANSVEGMSEAYLSSLDGEYAEPDLLGGWSMGGLVGLDAIRRFAAKNHRPLPGLLLIDSPPPTRPDAVSGPIGPIEDFAEFLWESFALSRYRPFALEVGGDDELGLALLAAGLDRAGEEVPLSWLSEWLVQYRRQLGVLAAYHRREPTPARALLMLGELTDAQVAEWHSLIGPGLTVERLGGGHFELLRPPLITEVSRSLRMLLTG